MNPRMIRRSPHPRVTAALALILGSSLLVPGHSAGQESRPVPAYGFRAEFLAQLTDVEKKLVDLARAVPAAKFAWRPAKDVRSVAEVYLHVAAGNYALPGFAGFKAPEGLDLMNLEKSAADSAKVVETVQKSFAFARDVTLQIPDNDLDRAITMFGGMKTTVRGMLLTMATHQHEHLGQSIAYARMNGVVPPWTAERAPRPKAP